MMFLMEMYAVVIITLMTAALGLEQSCVNYCKTESNQSKSFIREDCNCTSINEPNLSTFHVGSSEDKTSEIDYDPLKLNATERTPDEKSLDLLIESKSNESEYENINVNETLSVDDVNNMNNSSLEIYNANNENSTDYSNNIEFPLYLDINLYKHGNISGPNLKKELIQIFEKVRASEKYSSRCVNLHVYIFSKHNDNNNQTDTNSAQNVNNDNLSRSEILTEIQNKCDQRTTVIHESIYEIRQREQKEDESSEKSQEATSTYDNSTYDAEDKGTIQELSRTNYTNHESTDLVNNDLLETTTNSVDITDKENVGRHGLGSDTPYSQFDSMSANESDEKYYNLTTSRRSEPIVISDIDIRDSIKHKGLTRGVYDEKDILIPKIITKELTNDTLISIIDGYEVLPNSDFVSHYYEIARMGDNSLNETDTSQQSGLSDFSEDYDGNNTQSDVIQDTQGNFYFLYGNSQIPARFIQNFEGEMQLAVDGYSLCEQTPQNVENEFDFMYLLCGCIKFHKCSH